MFQAQLLISNATTSGARVYSPWFPKGGDNMLATVEIIAVNGTTPTLTIEVFSKAKTTTGDGSIVGSATGVTALGRTTLTQFSGLNELVRYRFDPGLTAVAGNWILFRMLPPVFFDTVK